MSTDKAESKKQKRKYLSQSDVPAYSLQEAQRVPKAIADNYAMEPVTPLQLASALNMSPTSGPFRMLCGASIAYGLTKGGYNAKQIELEPLGERMMRPLEEGDDFAAEREATIKPRIIGEFINKYAGASLPRHDIALNVLVDMGVPREKAESVYELIIESAQSVGFIREIKNKQYIDLSDVIPQETTDENEVDDGSPEDQDEHVDEGEDQTNNNKPPLTDPKFADSNRRVFITHGKNQKFIDPIKKLLGFGELTPVVSTEKQTVSKPVPDKVMDDMRGCGAAIIHVDAEKTYIDKEANEHAIINSNVLIEIGAAMALYGRRFILLVKDGVELPSNLQGLYEVRYKGDSLDGEATIRLLEAINDIKNNPLPDRYNIKGN